MTVPSITPVLLSGGSGTRLWPLSRRAVPKQFLPLMGNSSLLQETAQRVRCAGFFPPLVICNQEHRFQIAEQIRVLGMSPAQILLEPVGRNTAPAAAVAAIKVMESDPDGLLLLLPSDHAIRDQAAFGDALGIARRATNDGALVTFGIAPTAPQTGYGYIRSGAQVSGVAGAFAIAQFVEKPDLATAQSYLAAGGYYWNSGMFLFRARDFLVELERLQPQVVASCREALALARVDIDFTRLDEASFAASPAISIDYAVMEHTDRAVVVPAEMGWSDVGSWQSLWEISRRDPDGNAIHGDVITERVRNCYLHSDGPLVAALGIEDIAVIATKDAVLVGRLDASQDVKRIVEKLEAAGREQHLSPAVVHRPWGSYESIDAGANFQVKHIMVKPGHKLSLQMHHHRAEHWVVVGGIARVTRGDEEFLLQANETIYIPAGARHRLENPGQAPLHLIEVQSGAYLGEDDIVRFEDDYGRTLR